MGGKGTPGTREGGGDTLRLDSHSARKFRIGKAKATAVGVFLVFTPVKTPRVSKAKKSERICKGGGGLCTVNAVD
jgi:hypothetical protein